MIPGQLSESAPESLSKRLPFILTGVFSVIVLVFIIIFLLHEDSDQKIELSQRLISINNILDYELRKESLYMQEFIELIKRDKEIIDALKVRSREKLLTLSTDRFEQMNKELGITHFYYTGPDRINILRVHTPKRYGDTINRVTTINAEKTRRYCSGIELGIMGTLTLRVVTPIYENGTLIGFIELGKELDHIVDFIKNIHDMDLYVAIYKRFIDRGSWEKNMAIYGNRADYNLVRDVVLVNSDNLNTPQYIIDTLSSPNLPNSRRELRIYSNGKIYIVSLLPIKDISERNVGLLVVNQDKTKTFMQDLRLMITMSSILLLSIISIFILLRRYFSGIDKQIVSYNSNLQDTVRERTRELAATMETLSDDYSMQNILNDILLIPNLDTSLKELLSAILSRILYLRWFSHAAKGIIFLADKDTNSMSLFVQSGISGEITCTCKEIAYGDCLCGKAALSYDIILDKAHDDGGIDKYGHLIVPIYQKERFVAVLNLFVDDKFELTMRIRTFMTSIANTLAIVIDRKQKTDQLASSNILLKKMNDEFRSFSMILSHDLRAPLINLHGFCVEIDENYNKVNTYIQKSVGDVDSELSQIIEREMPEALSLIKTSATKIDKMLKALSELVRANKLEFEKRPVEVNRLVNNVILLFRYQISKAGIEIVVSELHDTIANMEAMEQIFANLLDNAIKYLSPVRSGKIEIYSEENEDFVTYHVRDNGKGIQDYNMARIFNLFYRVGDSDVVGEGIGLAHVKSLVIAHNGEIWCESEYDVGSLFSFKLPRGFN